MSGRSLKERLAKNLSRRCCQSCSTGFNSGDAGGSGKIRILPKQFIFFDLCHEALSSTRIAVLPGVTCSDISFKWAFIASMPTSSIINPTAISLVGHTAPKI